MDEKQQGELSGRYNNSSSGSDVAGLMSNIDGQSGQPTTGSDNEVIDSDLSETDDEDEWADDVMVTHV